MKYVSIKNLDKYHAGYKDRTLIWCKVYFSMINSDPEFEMLDEIDKWRFIAFIILQLQSKKPIPIDNKYLSRKGFDLKKRPMSLTLQMLHNFIVYVTEDDNSCNVDIDKEVYKEDKELDKEKENQFEEIWEKYPGGVGKKKSLSYFKSSVLTDQDLININKALDNYIISERVKNGYIQNGPTWFNNWKDWINYKEKGHGKDRQGSKQLDEDERKYDGIGTTV